ncbi:MAG: helix-turn-helix domain-containing protein [Bacillota bacterium]|nr:helix-turn-helix domain-containing protein [Bacillota bacterium]
MNEKEILIIETAIKLFAQKGFSSTSIQEIAVKSGISKGAFYLHFKSKEALLLAIFQFYIEKFKKEVFLLDNKNLQPKAQFLRQLTGFLKNIIEHHEFIIMISREQSIPINESTKKLIYQLQIEIHESYHKSFRSIFGKNAEPFLWDLSVMTEGILQGYIKVLLFSKENIDLELIAMFIYNRIEAVYKDLIESNEIPVLSQNVMKKIKLKASGLMERGIEDVREVIETMKQALAGMENLKNREDLIVSLEVVEAELVRQTPRPAVIHGMLSNFKDIPLFEAEIKKILSNY